MCFSLISQINIIVKLGEILKAIEFCITPKKKYDRQFYNDLYIYLWSIIDCYNRLFTYSESDSKIYILLIGVISLTKW